MLLANGTFTAQGCTRTGGNDPGGTQPTCSGSISTYPVPTNGAVYVETTAVVSWPTQASVVNGRVTIAANDDMIVAGDISYVLDGDDVLGLIGKNDVIVASWGPYDLDWHAAVIAQNGARHSWNSCGCKGTATHTGSSASNQHPFMDMFAGPQLRLRHDASVSAAALVPGARRGVHGRPVPRGQPLAQACPAGLIRKPVPADMQTVNLALAALALPPALAFGSFVNVVAARVPLRRSISHPRSACLACDAPIAARDNVPVLSYILLHGRCRHCQAAISPLYPAVEVLTAILVVVCVLDFGATAYAALAAFFCVTLVTLSAADLRYRLVPNRIVLPAFVICLLARTAIDPSVEWVAAALAASTLMLVFALIHPAGLGMGDVKLPSCSVRCWAHRRCRAPDRVRGRACPVAVLLARHGSKARKMAIPLVPFLALGALVALFFGDTISTGISGLGS